MPGESDQGLCLDVERHGNNVFIDGLPRAFGSVHANALGAHMPVGDPSNWQKLTARASGQHGAVIELVLDVPAHPEETLESWVITDARPGVDVRRRRITFDPRTYLHN